MELHAAIPSPSQGVWEIGPFPLRGYALAILLGIVVAIVVGDRRWRARGGQPGTVADVALWAVPLGIVGGRLYHVLTDWETYFGPGGNPVDALRIWHGELGIWGAISLGAVGALIGCRRHGVPLPFFADAVAPGIVTARRLPRGAVSIVAAWSTKLTAERGEAMVWTTPRGTGSTAGRPRSGSRMMPEKKPEAAALGLPGRTQIVGNRTDTPSRRSRRDRSSRSASPISFCVP